MDIGHNEDQQEINRILNSIDGSSSVKSALAILPTMLQCGGSIETIQNIVQASKNLLDSGNIEASITLLEASIKVLPRPEFRVALADAYINQHRVADCLRECFKVIEEYPGSDSDGVRLKAAAALGGVYHAKSGSVQKPDLPFDGQAAISLVNTVLQNKPNSQQANALKLKIIYKLLLDLRDYKGFHNLLNDMTIRDGPIHLLNCFGLEQSIKSQQPKYVFIHIPKCGGSSVMVSLKGTSIEHRYFRDTATTPQSVEDFYYVDKLLGNSVSLDAVQTATVFTTIRNIWSFLASYYLYMKSMDNVSLFDVGLALQYSFSDFVKLLVDRDDRWPWRKFMYFPLFSQPSGRLVVNYVCRLESLQSDMNSFLSSDDNAPVKMSHINKTSSQKDSWKNLYCDKTIQLVADTWKRDIDLFGFDFDKGYSDHSGLHGDISHLSRCISYTVLNDHLEDRR